MEVEELKLCFYPSAGGLKKQTWVEGNFAGTISCLRYHLAKCPEGLRVPPHSSLLAIPIRRQGGGASRQCQLTRQQLHHESDGTAACSYPGTRPPGVVACAHDNRPLLGLVAFRPRNITNINAGGLEPLQRGQSPPPPLSRNVSPRQANAQGAQIR